jgi:hypothetical protein
LAVRRWNLHHEWTPTIYTAEIGQRILEELASGRTLRNVCRDDGVPPHNTVMGWVTDDREGFAPRYKRAREIGYHAMADEILEIADDSSNDAIDPGSVRRARLRCKARQWMLAKALPKHYGNCLDPNAGREPVDTLAALLKAIDE